MPGRILVVNPNTSPEVTAAYMATARAVVPQGVILTGATGRFGARIVSTPAENVVAGHSALDLVAEHAEGQDSVILAISFDTALDALRSVLSIPVVGISEAALRAATAPGWPVGVVFFGEVSRGLYEQVLARNGIVPVGMEAVEVAGAADYLSPEEKDAAVLDACLRLQGQGAGAIVILGAAIVGMAARLAPKLSLPVHDGIEAVHACLSGRMPAARGHGHRPLGENVGLSPALGRLLRGDDG